MNRCSAVLTLALVMFHCAAALNKAETKQLEETCKNSITNKSSEYVAMWASRVGGAIRCYAYVEQREPMMVTTSGICSKCRSHFFDKLLDENTKDYNFIQGTRHPHISPPLAGIKMCSTEGTQCIRYRYAAKAEEQLPCNSSKGFVCLGSLPWSPAITTTTTTTRNTTTTPTKTTTTTTSPITTTSTKKTTTTTTSTTTRTTTTTTTTTTTPTITTPTTKITTTRTTTSTTTRTTTRTTTSTTTRTTTSTTTSTTTRTTTIRTTSTTTTTSPPTPTTTPTTTTTTVKTTIITPPKMPTTKSVGIAALEPLIEATETMSITAAVFTTKTATITSSVAPPLRTKTTTSTTSERTETPVTGKVYVPPSSVLEPYASLPATEHTPNEANVDTEEKSAMGAPSKTTPTSTVAIGNESPHKKKTSFPAGVDDSIDSGLWQTGETESTIIDGAQSTNKVPYDVTVAPRDQKPNQQWPKQKPIRKLKRLVYTETEVFIIEVVVGTSLLGSIISLAILILIHQRKILNYEFAVEGPMSSEIYPQI